MATLRVAVKRAVAPMRVAQISKPGADFEIVDRKIPEPGAGHVRIKVQACGVCHSDVLTKEGLWPGIQYPRVPGHELAGIIDEVGAGVSAWKKGQRVGVGWHGGQDGTCREYTAKLNWFLPGAMIPALAMISTAAETLFGLLLVLGWRTRITALLSGILLVTFAVTMTVALGVQAPLNLSVFSAAGGALLLGVSTNFPFSLDELLQRNGAGK